MKQIFMIIFSISTLILYIWVIITTIRQIIDCLDERSYLEIMFFTSILLFEISLPFVIQGRIK